MAVGTTDLNLIRWTAAGQSACPSMEISPRQVKTEEYMAVTSFTDTAEPKGERDWGQPSTELRRF